MTKPPWTPEHAIDREQAAQLLASQFAELCPLELELLGVGWDNTAYLVNHSLVFRFPRREIAVALLANETRVLPRIAPRLPLSVPVPSYVGRPERAYPWPFAGYPLLQGQTACRAKLTDEQRARDAAPLGAFLAKLHAIELEGLEAPSDELHRADMARRVPLVLEWLQAFEREGIVDDTAPYRRLLECEPLPPPGAEPRLVHGDLYARHILVDDKGRPTGIIDWGDLHAGDPAVDLAVAHDFLPASARARFLEAYGPVDERTWDLARLRGLFHATAIVHYGHEVGDRALFEEGLQGMAFVLEDA